MIHSSYVKLDGFLQEAHIYFLTILYETLYNLLDFICDIYIYFLMATVENEVLI